MKTIPLSLILAGLAGSWIPVASAESEGQRPEFRKPEGKMPPHRPASELWKAADLDRDGVISRGEFDQMPRVQKLDEEQRGKLFGRLDKDQDGKIGLEEIRQLLQHQHREGMMPRIWELDKDQDGGVSFEEFKQGGFFQKLEPEKQQRIFSRLDSNGDGRISPDDKPQHRPMGEDAGRGPGEGFHRRSGDHPGPGAMIERLDQDKDQALSFDEFKAGPRAGEVDEETLKKRFGMMDRNGDGKLSKEDFRMGPRREGKVGEGEGREKPPGGPVVD